MLNLLLATYTLHTSMIALSGETVAGLSIDRGALHKAQHLQNAYGWEMGVEHASSLHGGWRGVIEIEPQWPVGPHRVHLDHIERAANDYEQFFGALSEHSRSAIRFRWRDIQLALFKSDEGNRSKVSAYAKNGKIGYNVYGALLADERGVRETLFHELFHLNDDGWSESVLSSVYSRIEETCGHSNACLSSYAPNSTMASNHIYAFHPDEGVAEYAAELALRYYREQRQVLLEGDMPSTPFKCQNAENREAWNLMRDQYFGGADAVAACE